MVSGRVACLHCKWVLHQFILKPYTHDLRSWKDLLSWKMESMFFNQCFYQEINKFFFSD